MPLLVAIAGATCAGKTTTARALGARLGWVVSEADEHVAPGFDAGGLNVVNATGEIEVEMWFLGHYRKLAWTLRGVGSTVCDWSFTSALAHAKVLLGDDTLGAYEAAYARATAQVRTPDLWIVLAPPVKELKRRKAVRQAETGRTDDVSVPQEWLERVQPLTSTSPAKSQAAVSCGSTQPLRRAMSSRWSPSSWSRSLTE